MLVLNNITFEFGSRALYQDAFWHIKPNEKIGLIGANGTGKSTLLRIINGEYQLSGGEMSGRKDISIAFLNQDLLSYQSDDSILMVAMEAFEKQNKLQHQIQAILDKLDTDHSDETLHKLHDLQHEFEMLDGYNIQSKAEEVMEGLGFTTEQLQQPLRTFSGGWRMRVMLAKILLQQPDLLLLDEPTNHLDLPSIEWLEKYLVTYTGTFIIVSHDRYFLDKVVNRIAEIANQKITVYTGNYSFYLEEKAQREELRGRLLEYKNRILKGEDFASMASAYSEDLGSAQQGGDLGFAKRGMMVPEFEGAALRLKPNEISDPIESDFGLHLIQLLEIRGAEYHARHILLRPDYNRMDMTDATKVLDSLRKLIPDSVKFDIVAKKWSEDKQTADAGGLIVDNNTGSSKLALDASMDYALYMMVDTMKVGSVSQPLNYRTLDGKTAMRIIYYKSKTEPHVANLKDDFEKLTNIVLSNKRTRAIDQWFRKAVSDVFIKVEPEYQGCKIYGVNDGSN